MIWSYLKSLTKNRKIIIKTIKLQILTMKVKKMKQNKINILIIQILKLRKNHQYKMNNNQEYIEREMKIKKLKTKINKLISI